MAFWHDAADRTLAAEARMGFGGHDLDRLSEQRGDAARLEAFKADPRLRAVAITGDRVATAVTADGLAVLHDPAALARLGVTLDDAILLGITAEGAPRFGVPLPWAAGSEAPVIEPFKFIDLRSLLNQGTLARADLAQLAQARSMLHWHQTHRFCSACGAPSQMTQGGYRRDCPACGAQHFPRTDPVAIMMAIDGDRCLLGRQPRFPPGMYSCLAGFIEPGETIETAVRREIREEAGIVIGRVGYHSSQPWPFPASLMIGCFGEAVTSAITIDHDELEDARWFGRDEVRLMLARTHPDGLTTPPPTAIAHVLMQAFVARPD